MMKLKNYLKNVINKTPIVIKPEGGRAIYIHSRTFYPGEIIYHGKLEDMPLPMYMCIRNLQVRKVSIVKKRDDDETFAICFEI